MIKMIISMSLILSTSSSFAAGTIFCRNLIGDLQGDLSPLGRLALNEIAGLFSKGKLTKDELWKISNFENPYQKDSQRDLSMSAMGERPQYQYQDSRGYETDQHGVYKTTPNFNRRDWILGPTNEELGIAPRRIRPETTLEYTMWAHANFIIWQLRGSPRLQKIVQNILAELNSNN